MTIWDGHEKTIFDIAKECSERVKIAKQGKDAAHNKSTQLANFVPSFIAQPLAFTFSYLAAVLGCKIKALGLDPESFGHCVLTNVGPLGYTTAIAPLCPIVHHMAIMCTGAIQKRAIVDENDNIVVANMMTVMGTGDHRYGDAASMIPFFKVIRGFLEDPENFDPEDLARFPEKPHYKEVQMKEKLA